MYRVTVKETKTGKMIADRICKNEKDAKKCMKSFLNIRGYTVEMFEWTEAKKK